ncbi:nuclear transport factor 2 family protein [Sphingoaurantiacus capsulatus]|uniref:Nuclear transport factor 2 family protein n=1 Tax=Sphingoaurantiacus capsulatus TaxID=1771310 RepID=A0ABV7XBY5_9SPHN
MSDAKQAAMAVWAAFGSRDADQVRAVLTEDACWLAPRGNATQLALGMAPDALETREGIIDFLVSRFREAFPDGASFDFTNVIADGSTVVFEERMRGRTSTGRDYDNLYCWVFEMKGERVRRIREYMDTLAGYRMFFGDDAIPAR